MSIKKLGTEIAKALTNKTSNASSNVTANKTTAAKQTPAKANKDGFEKTKTDKALLEKAPHLTSGQVLKAAATYATTPAASIERAKTFLAAPELLAGNAKTCAVGGDPVNMSTGNFICRKTDLEIPGTFPLQLQRFYNALGGPTSVLGKNWTHNFNIQLAEKNQTATITFEDGHAETYHRQTDGSYLAPKGNSNILVKTQENDSPRFVLTFPDTTSYAFNPLGLLLHMRDANGNTTTLGYEDGRLSQVDNPCGQLLFHYTPHGYIAKVVDSAQRCVVYGYKDDCLTSVTCPDGSLHSYTYDSAGKLLTLTNPAGVVSLRNTYDAMGRITQQYFADDGTIDMAYEGFLTTTTEQNGNKLQYLSDEKFRTVEIRHENNVERFEYNDEDKPTFHMDLNGNIRRYAYDTQGNLIQSINPLGHATTAIYNEMGKPTSFRFPNASEVSLAYDAKGNLLQSVDPLKRTTGFAYNPKGLLNEVAMPDGSCIRYAYDERGNVTQLTNAQGHVTEYAYDALNRVIQTRNPEGHLTRFAYDSHNNIIKVTNAEGNSRHYEYNALGKVSKLTDFNGAETRYVYNKVGKIQEVVDPNGNSTTFEYDKMWNLRRMTNPLGHSTQYVYNLLGYLTAVVDPEGHVTSFEHDAKGNLTSSTSATGVKTCFCYDAMDRVIRIEEDAQTVTCLEYDLAGNLVKLTNPMGHVEEQCFDLAGQLIKRIDALGNATHFSYSPLGHLETTTDATGATTHRHHALGGQLQSILFPSGESQTFTYDKNGNIVQVTDALGQHTCLRYDAMDRVVEIKNPLGHSKYFAYDAAGNICQATDENGNITRYAYALTGQLLQVTDALGHTTQYGYDKAGQRTQMQQFRLLDETYAQLKHIEVQETSWKRNRKGEVVEKRTPLGELCSYAYDAVGNLVSKIDEDGLKTLYEYNQANKLAKVVYADGKTVELGYNPLKQLTQFRDWLGTTYIQTDALGRIEKVTDFEGKTVQYELDALGRRTGLIYPDSSKVDYAWNAAGRLESVQSPNSTTQFRYDAQGRLREQTMGDLSTQYELDPLGRFTSLTHRQGDKILDKFHYSYDAVGNITQIEKQRTGVEADSGRFCYAYDAVGQLIEATCGQKRKQYGYDSLGNRVFSQQDGMQTQHSYNARNQLVRTQTPETTKEYGYDRRGNLTRVLENGKPLAHYVFDATNCMTQAVTPERGRAEYVYNGFLKRVKRLEKMDGASSSPVDPMGEIRYVLDMSRPYNNLLATEGAQNQKYVWANKLLAAEGSETFHYLTDHLGSPVRLVGKNMDSPLAYDEFGVPLLEGQEKCYNPFGFTGYQTDEASGLYYAQLRYYEPTTSRMISEDPICSGPNWYAYVNNNPINYIDPLGLEKVVVSGGIYSQDKRNANAYYYEFIDAALAQINEWNKSGSDEKITWVIADHGWSDLNKSEFKKTAKRIGVDLVFISDTAELTNYINNQSINNNSGDVSSARLNEPITNISFFSHGLNSDGGVVSLGYDYTGNYPKSLDLHKSDIANMNASAFSSNLQSDFYSCNTGTAGADSFAQHWVNAFGGTTTAFSGKSDYANVSDNSLGGKLARKWIETVHGVSAYGGNTSLPVEGTNAEQKTFKRSVVQRIGVVGAELGRIIFGAAESLLNRAGSCES